MDLGGFTGNSRGGRPAYHPMDEVDFEIQQRSEPTEPPTIHVFFLYIDLHRISQTNPHKVLAVEVEDQIRHLVRTAPLEDVEVAAVVEVSLRNLHQIPRCRDFGMKKGHCYDPSHL